MKAVLDVHYRDDRARAVCVSFQAFSDPQARAVHSRELAVPADYAPGRFFERELPCLLAVLEVADTPFDTLLVDGFVHLEPPRKGLGAHLADALPHAPVIIGVAKSRLAVAARFAPLQRGRSRKPLYVSCLGCPLPVAVDHVAAMHGRHRLPTLVRLADRLSRDDLQGIPEHSSMEV